MGRHSVAFAIPGASGRVGPGGSGQAEVCGFAFTETGGSAAGKIRLRESTVTGKIIASLSCVASGSAFNELPCVQAVGGVYVELVTGTVEGAIYIR